MSTSVTEFEELWAWLKAELTLTDEDLTLTDEDFKMGYKVKIHNGLALLGWLSGGKARRMPRYYPHPSAAKRAAESYVAKHPGHKYEIIAWNTQGEQAAL